MIHHIVLDHGVFWKMSHKFPRNIHICKEIQYFVYSFKGTLKAMQELSPHKDQRPLKKSFCILSLTFSFINYNEHLLKKFKWFRLYFFFFRILDSYRSKINTIQLISNFISTSSSTHVSIPNICVTTSITPLGLY